jgi:hypothetical protein
VLPGLARYRFASGYPAGRRTLNAGKSAHHCLSDTAWIHSICQVTQAPGAYPEFTAFLPPRFGQEIMLKTGGSKGAGCGGQQDKSVIVTLPAAAAPLVSMLERLCGNSP